MLMQLSFMYISLISWSSRLLSSPLAITCKRTRIPTNVLIKFVGYSSSSLTQPGNYITMAETKDYLDVLIVGAGFSGMHMLVNLRRAGFSVKIYEAGSDLGGVWFWNRYPGARVDTETPIYQLIQEKEVWEDFQFTERFPGWAELRRYFHHADKKLGLSQDILYNTTVTGAAWDESRHLWSIQAANGTSTLARYLVLCTGFAAKKYTPAFPGLESFSGQVYHSADWPLPKDVDTGRSSVDLKGKRVAVIGTGASGVQIIQEIGNEGEVAQLTVYQRTPNLALPMRQTFANSKENGDQNGWQFPKQSEYGEIFGNLFTSFGGIRLNFAEKKWADASPEERVAIFEKEWIYGGFGFWLATFAEIFFVQAASDEAYAFWAEKVRPRIKDEVKRELLAPQTPPHCWGTKRPSLEQSYFEVYNNDWVHIVDVNVAPISKITPRGIQTEGKEAELREFDVIILATGFDSVTGGILNIKIRNSENPIQEKWGQQGTRSFLGMASAGFPNMFWMYGPQAPTAFSNGPTCTAVQGGWILDLLVEMRKGGKGRVEAEVEAENGWVKTVNDLWDNSLFAGTESWYQGSNIPGKRKEALNFIGGIPVYKAALDGCREKGYEGFKIA